MWLGMWFFMGCVMVVVSMIVILLGIVVGLPITEGVDDEEGNAYDEHHDHDLQLVAQVGLVMS